MNKNHEDIPAFTIAFQPIVTVGETVKIFAYEVLVRGPNGQGAAEVIGSTPAGRLIELDAACRL